MRITTASEAIDEAARLVAKKNNPKANSVIATWLDVSPSTVSCWRERGISRNFAMHFFAELVEKRGHKLSPEVFGLDSWRVVLMPDARGRKLRRVA